MSLFLMSILMLAVLTLFGTISGLLDILQKKKFHVLYLLLSLLLLHSFIISPMPEIEINAAVIALFIVSCIILYRYKRTVTGIGLILTGCFCIVSAAVNVLAESTEPTALLLGILPALIVPIKRDHASAIAAAGLIPVVSEMLRALFEMLNLGYGTVRLGSFTSDVQLLGVLITAATAQTLLILSPNGYGEEKI